MAPPNFWVPSLSQSVSSVAQSCPTLCDPMDRSTPGLPVHHQLPEFTQTHIHWIGDAIQPSHPLSSPSPPAFNLCQHQGLFKWVSSSHQVAKVLEFQLQHPSDEYSGLISFRTDWLDLLAVQGTLKSLLQHHSSKATETLITCRVSHLKLLQSLQCCDNFFSKSFFSLQGYSLNNFYSCVNMCTNLSLRNFLMCCCLIC